MVGVDVCSTDGNSHQCSTILGGLIISERFVSQADACWKPDQGRPLD